MSLKSFVILVILAIIVNVNVSEQKILKNLGNCGNDRLNFPPFEPSCPNSIVEPQCRYAELTKPACSDLPCTGNLKLNIDIKTETPPGSCCRRCTCYGDPHCESFEGKEDSWVLCDSRNENTNKPYCPFRKSICSKQTDHNGNQCEWNDAKKWNVPLQGSRCSFKTGPGLEQPSMLMYKADDYSFETVLGERGIIKKAIVKVGNKKFEMSGNTCYNNADSWTPSFSSLSRIITQKDPINGGKDIRVVVEDTNTGIIVIILCTRNVVNGKSGFPRLNIENLIEPLAGNDRKNPSGFCHTGKIEKGLSGDNVRSRRIKDLGLCTTNVLVTDLKMSQNVKECGIGSSRKSLEECKKTWCLSQYSDEWEKCVDNINKHGWVKTWCSANTLLSKNPEKCMSGSTKTGNSECKACINEFEDFGVKTGLNAWLNYADSTPTEYKSCELMTVKDPCQKSIDVQYKIDGNWTTYGHIEYGCNSLDFDSQKHPKLFHYPIRLSQCPIGKGCSRNYCEPDAGFGATIKFIEAPKMCPCPEE